ncbi:MAG: DUF433 domain-containing protein [Terracidiphilus sp.]|jgi:hypothetical protein
MANLDWSQCDAVESVPGKVSGAWVFKGTRMPVSAIFENIAAGAEDRRCFFPLFNATKKARLPKQTGPCNRWGSRADYR